MLIIFEQCPSSFTCDDIQTGCIGGLVEQPRTEIRISITQTIISSEITETASKISRITRPISHIRGSGIHITVVAESTSIVGIT